MNDLNEDNIFGELTAEEIDFDFDEIKKNTSKIKDEIAQKGFLPCNPEYDEVISCPQEEVEHNPKRYIIEECIPACQELWSKNIYTFMVSDYLNDGCWIEIFMDSLSPENKEIYTKLNGEDILKFSYHLGTVNFGVKYVGALGRQKLLELAQQFKMQDVPSNLAYIGKEEFLINYCDCYDEVPNPDYYELPDYSNDSNMTIEEKAKHISEYENWLNSIASHKTIRKLNLNKMSKPLEQLVKDKNMILDGNRVYLSLFHYQKHQNYLKALENGLLDESPNIKR